MRCEGLTALQAAGFSIGGNGGKVKQQCVPGAMSSGGREGLGQMPWPAWEPCPDARMSHPGTTTIAPGTSGEREDAPISGLLQGSGTGP